MRQTLDMYKDSNETYRESSNRSLERIGRYIPKSIKRTAVIAGLGLVALLPYSGKANAQTSESLVAQQGRKVLLKKENKIEFTVPRIDFTFPHLDEERTFVYPPVRGTNAECINQLRNNGLYQPTFSEIVSLVHGAWKNPDEKYSKEIIRLVREEWLKGSTGIHYIPNEGAYIQDHPKLQNGRVIMDKKDLVRKLESKDSSVRFVPFGYKVGEQKSRELAKNPFIIGLTGNKEQAEKLAEISGKYKLNFYLWIFNNVDKPITTVSALGSHYSYQWGRGDYRISFVASDHDDDGICFAFGVSAPKAK